jgi:hypothetical protein
MSDPHWVRRNKLFEQSSRPLEGENMRFRADLVDLTKNWSGIAASSLEVPETCPIGFTDDKLEETLRLGTVQKEEDVCMSQIENGLGVTCQGWTPMEAYEEVKRRASEVRRRSDAAEMSEEDRKLLEEHWPLSDFDEGDYEDGRDLSVSRGWALARLA